MRFPVTNPVELKEGEDRTGDEQYLSILRSGFTDNPRLKEKRSM